MATIHPTAIVDSSAVLADSVEIGPYAIVEADVTIGEGTVLASHAIVRQYTTLGKNNKVDSFAVLGGLPQDYKFDPDQKSYLAIGDANIFRECVTINRATGENESTTIGNECYWMAYSHAGHNVTVGNNVIMPNSCQVAGHCVVGDGAILPANGSIHQFVWIGEKCMFQGGSKLTMHTPPYCLLAQLNNVVSLNIIGLRRDPRFSDEDRKQIKEAFSLLYRQGLTPRDALAKMETCTDWGDPAGRFRDFVKKAYLAEKPFNRGIVPHNRRKANRGDV